MAAFKGFDEDFVGFFRDLDENNSKEWFDANRKRYDNHVVSASRGFVEAITPKLQEFVPEIQGIPKANKSFGRINRDIRFSKDKTPYNTHWTIRFWEGAGKPKDSPGFTMWLGAEKIMFAAGQHGWSKEQLTQYRDAVADPKSGKEFGKIVKALEKGGFGFWGDQLKKVPPGYDKDHANAEFLKYKAMGAFVEVDVPKEFYKSDFLDFTVDKLEKLADLHHWIVANVD